MQKESRNAFFIVGLFAVAMAFLESAVVVYLRALYYKNGFEFPLVAADSMIINVDLVREAATIIMLICAGVLAGKTFYQRFAYFLFAFGVWDIFYYVWLKVILNWPASLMTWDLLFLIPWPWVGPVLAPIILSMSMIVFAILIVKFSNTKHVQIKFYEWALLVVGSLFALYSFMIDYGRIIFTSGVSQEFYAFIPQDFSWAFYGMGEVLIVAAILSFYYRYSRAAT